MEEYLTQEERIAERDWMVDTQLIKRGIEDELVLKAMKSVPRHLFVKPEDKQYAYYDEPLLIDEEQTISQPFVVALMAEKLELTSMDRVLEIGTGSGYSAAVLSRVCSEVYTIERHEVLAKQAIERFRRLGYNNIHVRVGDGTEGWEEKAPFDAILVTAGGPFIPESLLKQLGFKGRLVIPVGGRREQELIRVRRKNEDDYVDENLGPVRFVPLIGSEGWKM